MIPEARDPVLREYLENISHITETRPIPRLGVRHLENISSFFPSVKKWDHKGVHESRDLDVLKAAVQPSGAHRPALRCSVCPRTLYPMRAWLMAALAGHVRD